MRKTPFYGWDHSVDFEWPKANDLMQMLNNTKIRIKELKYQPRPPGNDVFGAFQVILKNGVSSPIFTAKD